MNFITNLWYMGIGMLGIFIVIGVIILLTMLLNNITSKK
ncbi:MAG: oxaloacetate decarboxylase [Clostridia bacterium]|nr:oxaloacetate decarboxylase [Oscillospiraceae bacterium]MBQ7960488.1 oxaloacetate decarboxylase [Clostridia bacterium]